MTLEHAGEIWSLEFLPDGHIASGNIIGEIMLWDTVTGSRIKTVNAHSHQITSLSASQTKLASSSDDKTVRVWETTSWECISLFECDNSVRSVMLYPSCDRVAACTEETLYVWDTVTQQRIASQNLNKGKDVAVSRDGKWLAVASKSTSLYDASTLHRVWSYDNNDINKCESVTFSPDSCQLVSLYRDVQVFNALTGDIVKFFQHDYVERAVFSNDGTRLISGMSCYIAL